MLVRGILAVAGLLVSRAMSRPKINQVVPLQGGEEVT